MSVRTVAGAVVALGLLAEPVLAHAGGLGAAASGSAPLWFVLLTGGAIVGGSFLFATLLTDHEAIRAINAWRLRLPVPSGVARGVGVLAGVGSVLALAGVLVVAFLGPAFAESNAAVLVVWGGWWAGYTMSVYLLGNTWSLVNPWRWLVGALARLRRVLPDRLASAAVTLRQPFPGRLDRWPAVAGLLGLIWLEVVSPIASNPRLLGAVVIGYTVVTLAGAAVFGRDVWFDRVDPITNVFRCFGRLAPFQRTDDGLAFGLPSSALARPTEVDRDETPFVIALLWVTTYDGLVSTPQWGALAEFLVADLGVPGLVVYLVALVGGYALFLWVYRAAAARSRESADSLVSVDYIRRWFVPSLLPIAAGYHVAHFLGYFLRLSGALVATLSDPLTAGSVSLVTLPGWYGSLQLVFVLVGHLFAIWVAHALSFELFPGKLQPIRSQYPFTAVMVFYTMTSMWIVAQPFSPPPYTI